MQVFEKPPVQHWDADTSVPVAVWSKGRIVNIWAKLDTTGDSAGRRHKIPKSKWDVLSIENMKDLKSRTTTQQRREGNTFRASLSTVYKV